MTDKENPGTNALESLVKSFSDKQKLDADEAAAKQAKRDEMYNLAKGGFAQAFAVLEQDGEIDELEKARRFGVAASVLLNGSIEVTTTDPKQTEVVKSLQERLDEANAIIEVLRVTLAEAPKLADEELALVNAMQSGRIYSDGEGEEKVYKDRRIPELAKQKREAQKADKQASESASSEAGEVAVPKQAEPMVVDKSAKGSELASSQPGTEPADEADSAPKPPAEEAKIDEPPIEEKKFSIQSIIDWFKG